MATIKCGWNSGSIGAGSDLLEAHGPTLLVDIGFDPKFRIVTPPTIPVPGVKAIMALVDTGATESCIDNQLAKSLNLPLIDQRQIVGSKGAHVVDVHLAQIHVPGLGFTIYGAFSAVELVAGQKHLALIGRTFLRHFKMLYNGPTGDVEIFT